MTRIGWRWGGIVVQMRITYRQLEEVETGRLVVARLERADSLWKQTVGLIGRREMAEDTGLWLAPCNGIHTFGMRFALDVVFLDREGVVLRLAANVRPWRICGPVWGARAVIELPAGTIAFREITSGCRYRILP